MPETQAPATVPQLPPSEVQALILAGGQSRRMGQDKAWVEWRGQPLIAHALNALHQQTPVAPHAVWLSAAHPDPRHASLGLAGVVADSPNHAGCGPLAGIWAGLQASTSDWLLVVPCDTPRLPTDLLSRLTQAIDAEHLVAVAATHTREAHVPRIHPVVVLLHRSCGPVIADQLARDDRRMMHWLQCQAHRVVGFDDPQAFTNVNDQPTLQQLA